MLGMQIEYPADRRLPGLKGLFGQAIDQIEV